MEVGDNLSIDLHLTEPPPLLTVKKWEEIFLE
jgi:hypothetical protein